MKICLDYGHNDSGWDSGANYNNYREQDITFNIGKLLKIELERNGIEIVETRANKGDNLGSDVNSSLKARVEAANNTDADYFISLHCNSSTDSLAHGTETYVVAKGGRAEQLATSVNTAISSLLGTYNRGVKSANYYVIKNTKAPAILIEMGFLSNNEDRQLLLNSQSKFAVGIAKGVCGFLGITYKEVEILPVSTNKYSYDNTVEHLIKLGVTSIDNMSYWEMALAGTKPLDKDNVRIILDRLIKKCYE